MTPLSSERQGHRPQRPPDVKDNGEFFANRTVIVIIHYPANLERGNRIEHPENGRLTPLEPIR